jgi:hypothetical protein
MPGLVGGVGVAPERIRRLLEGFRQTWGSCEVEEWPSGFVAAHAFPGGHALNVSEAGEISAVDGDAAAYRTGGAPGLNGDRARVANVVRYDPHPDVLALAGDLTGTFPLYYARCGQGLLFASVIDPLASELDAAVDPIGAIEFLRNGFTIGTRGLFRGIHRLLPGEAVRFEPRTGSLTTTEAPSPWAHAAGASDGPGVDHLWSLLGQAAGVAAEGRLGVMLSGGWDSRTLLAAASETHDHGSLLGYFHGDVHSRECRIASRIAMAAGAPLMTAPVDATAWEPAQLQRDFQRTGNAVFGHWHRAGRLLAAEGVRTVTAGVYGEILGGHYGPAMTAGPLGKAASVLRSLVGAHRDMTPGALRQGLQPFLSRTGTPWYLDPEFYGDPDAVRRETQLDLDRALDRLRSRGASRPQAQLEAFIAEHRGSHYINQQLLSCRSSLDVLLPFASGQMLRAAASVPLDVRVHNQLNQRMLRRHAPAFIDAPLAAVLLPAKAPLLAQELTRFMRRSIEDGRWRLYSRSAGRIPRPRLSWVDFEFLRDGKAIGTLVGDLKADVWNRDALQSLAAKVASPRLVPHLHPVYDQLAKIYTLDLLLR